MVRLHRLRPWLAVALATAAVVLLGGCMLSFSGGNAVLKVENGKMLHLQQVLERYDADGNAVPQYLEIWLAQGVGRCNELDGSGNVLDVALDTGTNHISFNVSTREAERTQASGIFIVNFANIKKAYPGVTQSNEGTYAGRDCEFYLLGNGKADEWVKLYVDKQTGCVLLCDAPIFRLRTALLEEVPVDASLFTEPNGLVFKGGAGK